MKRLVLVTAPTVEPVTTDAMKDHSRIDHMEEDGVVSSYEKAARQWCEKATGRAFVTQTWDLYMDSFPSKSALIIPMPPLQSVTSVTYYDEDNNSAVLASSNYIVSAGTPGRITLTSSGAWPSTSLRPADGVVVRFVAGYGDDASDVPEHARQAVRMLAAHLYENREPVIVGTSIAKLPFAVDALLSPEYYRTPEQ